MHILYLHQHFATPKGSTGTRSYEFARRWVKQGHEVLVLHSVPKYPYFLSRMIYLWGKKAGIENTQLTRLHQHREAVQSANYSFAGINIIRNPILKLIPHRDFFSFELRKHKASALSHIM